MLQLWKQKIIQIFTYLKHVEKHLKNTMIRYFLTFCTTLQEVTVEKKFITEWKVTLSIKG